MDVIERFLKYVSYDTTSNPDVECVPTSDKEFALANLLRDELIELGAKDVSVSEHCYVYAHLDPTDGFEGPAIGFVAHMDTSPDVSGANIKPRIIHYEGGDIELGNGVVTRVSEFGFLENFKGQDLIVTDGTTLLGSDDKAGVAEIMAMVEYLISHPEVKHGYIGVCFTPDEEVGLGTAEFEMDKFKCDYGYTVDGGTLGELEYENFNAASASVKINGLNIHPGSAKNHMKNAVLMAADYINMFPLSESPAHTEGYEGFYHISGVAGDESSAKVDMIIRDHDMEKFNAKKAFVENVVCFLNKKYGEGTFELTLKDSYYNMKEYVLPHMEIIDRAMKAYEMEDIKPYAAPIRGGTDGARLSYMGLPCPNLSTGGGNVHSIHEFASVDAMRKMVKVLINIATNL